MENSIIDMLWVLICAGLVLTMQAGFLCLETGLTRTKNAINVAIKNLADLGVSVILFWLFGFGVMFGLTTNGLFGTSYFMVPFDVQDPWLSTFFIYQAMFCATAATIVSGAVAERMKFKGYILIVMIITAIIYPLFGHWAWGGAFRGSAGWLAEKGFVDFAGSTVVHSVGGWAALAALLVIGPRRDRFPEGKPPNKIPGSNLPMALLGVLLLFFGWVGFNGGSLSAMNEQVPGVVVNTVLAGGAGLIANLFVGWRLKGYPEITMSMNGALAGLVAITANCHAVSSSMAIVIGAIGGLIALMGEGLLEKNKIDDAIGAVPVHLFAGIWGTIAVALFGNPEVLGTGMSRWQQLQIQCIGIAVCGVFTFGITYALLMVFNRHITLRVSPEEEYLGLNVVEHKATTEVMDLLMEMEGQVKTHNLSKRIHEEPFTEVGQIAKQYNRVLESLEKMVKRTKSITKNISNGILSFGGDGILLSLNPAAEKIFGIKEERAVGGSLFDILKEFTQMDEKNVLKSIENKEFEKISGQRFNIMGVSLKGETKDVELTLDMGEVDQSKFYTAVVMDVTDRKKAEAELMKANSSLKTREEKISKMYHDLKESHEHLKTMQSQLLQSEKLASIGQLAAGVAHEINNPIGYINGNMQALGSYIKNISKVLSLLDHIKEAMEGNDLEKAKQLMRELGELEEEVNLDYIKGDIDSLIQESQGGIDRVRKIVLDLRTFSRDGQDLMEDVSLEEIIDGVLNIVSSEIKYKAKIKKEYGTTPRIKCNSQRLGQVFINLFINAAQSIEKKGLVEIKTYKNGKYVCAEVKDNGAGISKEDLLKIFDAFYTTKPIGQGTGLGLSISHEIIKNHGGDIQVESAVGKGTTFKIMLPFSEN